MKDTLFYILIGTAFLVAVVGLAILCMYAPILGVIIAVAIYLVINAFVDRY